MDKMHYRARFDQLLSSIMDLPEELLPENTQGQQVMPCSNDPRVQSNANSPLSKVEIHTRPLGTQINQLGH